MDPRFQYLRGAGMTLTNFLMDERQLRKQFSVILVQPQTSGNIGAVARAMKNMGFYDLRLVDPQAHHLNRECLERAMEAQPIVKKAKLFLSLKEAAGDCHHVLGTSRKKRSRTVPFQTLQQFSRDFLKKIDSQKIALVFGREDRGLTNEEVQICDSVIEIPTSKEFPSLNLSHAVIIVLYEIFMTLSGIREHTSVSKKDDISMASALQKEAFFDHLRKALLSIDFLHRNNPERIMRDLRNIFNRAALDEREVTILRGICRQMMNKSSRS